ncbi:C-C motif chemokine 22 [Sarcophilus harrisii]|uniref:C-C motif chemokine 22 n=1 Tax=Sarcophilus harrisii TaxID=9305 RepID=UPI0013020569|nr:C-C motif chemokine 22 [Sarcophilus harrisii]
MLHFQAALLMALILGTALPVTQAGPYGVNMENTICCKNFVGFPIPLKFLNYFYFTSKTCQKPGVILVTKRNLKICADSQKPWVEHAIKTIKKKKT